MIEVKKLQGDEVSHTDYKAPMTYVDAEEKFLQLSILHRTSERTVTVTFT